ncbi:MAG: ABC transporter permease [Planctomycetota bacterium]|jgi:peptide/nickel transport system permease protein|nr:ABC transporter permease [Planctomycetota bacterium]
MDKPGQTGSGDLNGAAPPRSAETPAGRLWRRLLKIGGARIGLLLILLFALTAFFAPFLAHRLPILWYEDGRLSFPLIREFFSPSDTTEPRLEKGINFLLLFSPLAWLAWRTMNRRFPRLAGRESKGLSLLFGFLFSALFWFSLGGMLLDAAGEDWFYSESAPVPELDDLADPIPLLPGDPAAAKIVRERLRELGIADFPPPATGEEERRSLLNRLQALVEGHPLPLPAGFPPEADAGGPEPGIDSARRNRILLENAFPGLLAPMRRFRSAFMALAFAVLAALAGLSYIFLAAAAQFTLSFRWLVLLGLGLSLSPAFWAPARHDHKPYRRLAAEGAGFGIFPLLPYGPNEQGFGPRLPPEWFGESPLLPAGPAFSPARLRSGLAESGPGRAGLAARLDKFLPDWRTRLEEPSGDPEITRAFNRLIEEEDFLRAGLAEGFQGHSGLLPYFAAGAEGRLEPPHRQRFNRLVLERMLPGAFVPAPARRWGLPGKDAGRHHLGTDESGRDVLVRIIHGARVSLSVGFVSVFLATVIGLVLGSLAAYYGGKTDLAISRLIEIMTCFPSFFLILAVIAVLDRRSIINIMLIIGLTSWPGVARLVRGEMLRQKKMDYVAASVALGAPDSRTIFRHILPNALAPVLVSISFGITGAILTEAGLSFIGFGVTPPTPTWGQLLSETRDSPLANWWLAVFPGLVLFLGVSAYNLVGEALRDALDPRISL